MSRSLNKVMLIGNTGADPEIRTTGSGSRVANVSLATSRRWTSQAGEQQEKTEWHRLVAWERRDAPGGDPFNVIERFVKKGTQLYVEGEIEYRSYEDKDGVTKYSTEIRIRDIMLLGSREGGAGGGYGGGGESGRREQGAGSRSGAAAGYDDFQAPPMGDEDDDLPF